MGNCTVFHDELRFLVTDPDALHVYVFLRAEGDCPFMVNGWHYKEFPASVTTFDVLKMMGDGSEKPINWERQAPGPVCTDSIFSPNEYVPVLAKELNEWQLSTVADDRLSPVDIADQMTARLTSSPNWHKACPHCRAHDMLMQAQMAPRE
jgi:hypothetical protein